MCNTIDPCILHPEEDEDDEFLKEVDNLIQEAKELIEPYKFVEGTQLELEFDAEEEDDNT